MVLDKWDPIYLGFSHNDRVGFLGKIKNSIDDRRERKRAANEEWLEYENKVNSLLDKFEIPDFDDFLMSYLNKKPEPEYVEDKDTGREQKNFPGRKEYLDFIWEYLEKNEINYNHLKDFALKTRIVSPSFFGDKTNEAYEKNDFESIVNSIKASFEPERISNEEHLEAQLVVFLKAKFPDRKIRRQVPIKSGDILDILVDDSYVFELKVPKNRTDLRNLGAQLEEYKEEYPNLCAIIFELEEELNLSDDITEYIDKYKRNHGVQSIIFGGKRRR